jgi:hypothetical protein
VRLAQLPPRALSSPVSDNTSAQSPVRAATVIRDVIIIFALTYITEIIAGVGAVVSLLPHFPIYLLSRLVLLSVAPLLELHVGDI